MLSGIAPGQRIAGQGGKGECSAQVVKNVEVRRVNLLKDCCGVVVA